MPELIDLIGSRVDVWVNGMYPGKILTYEDWIANAWRSKQGVVVEAKWEVGDVTPGVDHTPDFPDLRLVVRFDDGTTATLPVRRIETRTAYRDGEIAEWDDVLVDYIDRISA